MFPIKTGFKPTDQSVDPDQVMYQSIVAAAMHEIGRVAIKDCSVLLFHQEAAEVYYRQEQEIPIETNEDGTYIVYSDAEKKSLHHDLITVVMKFHILSDEGVVKKLDPLIDSLQSNVPLDEETLADPFIQRILNTWKDYSTNLAQQNMHQSLLQILDYSEFDDISEIDYHALIHSSYDSDPLVSVAIWEDNTVQCACDYCEGFFEILEEEDSIDPSELNVIQQILYDQFCCTF